MCKLFTSDRNTWYHRIVCKLFVFDRNTWYHINMCKLFTSDRNTWYHKTVCKLFVSSWLVVWVLWLINFCRLFNAKSILMKIVLFQTIQFSISTQLKCKYNLIVKNISISNYSVLRKTTPFGISMPLVLFNPYRALSSANTPDESGPRSDGNEGVLRIPLSSRITGTLPSDCLVSHAGHSLGVGSYPTAEKQSMYRTAPADKALFVLDWYTWYHITVYKLFVLDRNTW